MNLHQQWNEMLRRSFHPSQWFTETRLSDENRDTYTEDRIMYVYRVTDSAWSVGFFTPAGDWVNESCYGTREQAAERVHWLNGGS